MSDPGITYRSRDEITEYRKTKDPIVIVKDLLIKNSFATEKELKSYEKEVRKQIDDVVEQARKDPFPEPHELFTDIYHNDEGEYIRNVDFPTSLNKDFD